MAGRRLEFARDQAQQLGLGAATMGSRWTDSGLFLTSGHRFTARILNTNEDFDRLVAKARGASGYPMLAQGVHPGFAMELLGQSQINLTMNTFSHLMLDAMREAIERIGAMLGKAAVAS